MADVAANIVINAVGGAAAAADVEQVNNGFRNLSAGHDALAGRFQTKIQHIGLMLFARDAIAANGLGREARMMISLLNGALMSGASAFGSAASAALPWIAAITTLIGVISVVVSKHKETTQEILKHIDANNKLTTSYRGSIDAVEGYITAGGHMTDFLADYRKAQEDAKRVTDLATVSMEQQALVGIQQNISKLKDQIREQSNLNATAKLTTTTMQTNMGGVEALSQAYSRLGNDKVPKLREQLTQLNAEQLKHQGNIEALKAGYSTMDEMLKAQTKDLEDMREADKKTSDEMQKNLDAWLKKHEEAWQKANENEKHFAGLMETDFARSVGNMVMDGQRWQDALKDIFNSVVRDFIEMVAKMAAEWAAFTVLTGGFGMTASRASFLTGFFPKAQGGATVVDRPTLFLAGEGGEPEVASFTPLSKMGGGGGGTGGGQSIQIGSIVTNVSGVNDPDLIADQVGRKIVERIRGRGDLAFARAG